MPTYEYACKACGDHLDVVQSFSDDALTECPSCGGPLRKVFSAIGIAFKGSGFYKTDSRGSASASSSGSSGGGESSKQGEAATGDAKSGTKTDSKAGGADKGSGSTVAAS